jgi:hypothetical protein
MDQAGQWPALSKDEDGLLEEIQAVLMSRVHGDPYSSDGTFADNLSSLPRGLRAMAATHWLDVSLTLDSLTWHFGNFGEPTLVAQTEEGLAELGLGDLASVFHEAATLMLPFVDQKGPKQLPDQLLEKAGLAERGKRSTARRGICVTRVMGSRPSTMRGSVTLAATQSKSSAPESPSRCRKVGDTEVSRRSRRLHRHGKLRPRSSAPFCRLPHSSPLLT